MYGEKLTRPMTTIVLRLTNIYGPYDDFGFETSHVTTALVRKVIEWHNPIGVLGDGEDVRDIIIPVLIFGAACSYAIIERPFLRIKSCSALS
jgi:nucleoside-diphosphate-sugar epimerase